jgi:hypothetical protein
MRRFMNVCADPHAQQLRIQEAVCEYNWHMGSGADECRKGRIGFTDRLSKASWRFSV